MPGACSLACRAACTAWSATSSRTRCKSGTERVIGYLLHTEGEPAGEGAHRVALPVAKAVLASRLNLTPEHFSRVLHELAEQGLIGIDGRNIEIRDLERLRDYGN